LRAGTTHGKAAGKAGARNGAAAGARLRRPAAAPRPGAVPAAARAHDATQPPLPPASGLGWRGAIAATVSGLGYELVDVERGQRGLLRVFIDRLAGRDYAQAGTFVTVDDCEQVTRQLQYVLEVEGLDYARLEVSSPGLDRPLRTEADFGRFAGQAVSVTLKVAFQGRKVWQGVLEAAAAPVAGAPADAAGSAGGGGWSLIFKHGKTEQVFGFRLEDVREARLVPVVDFKGRRSEAVAPDGGPQAAVLPGLAAAVSADGGK
jgi:ribosome maturation factor RimP